MLNSYICYELVVTQYNLQQVPKPYKVYHI